jgi:mannose/fructose/N-acetylgalactosamine-specific phosphotransferase system component IID
MTTQQVIMRIVGMIFDIIVLGGMVWLIGWHQWNPWWMVLAVVACAGSWVVKSDSKKG